MERTFAFELGGLKVAFPGQKGEWQWPTTKKYPFFSLFSFLVHCAPPLFAHNSVEFEILLWQFDRRSSTQSSHGDDDLNASIIIIQWRHLDHCLLYIVKRLTDALVKGAPMASCRLSKQFHLLDTCELIRAWAMAMTSLCWMFTRRNEQSKPYFDCLLFMI